MGPSSRWSQLDIWCRRLARVTVKITAYIDRDLDKQLPDVDRDTLSEPLIRERRTLTVIGSSLE